MSNNNRTLFDFTNLKRSCTDCKTKKSQRIENNMEKWYRNRWKGIGWLCFNCYHRKYRTLGKAVR